MNETREILFKPLCFEDVKGILGDTLTQYMRAYKITGELLDKPFSLSPFVFLFKGRDYCALYHSLSIKKIFGDTRLVKIFSMGRAKKPLRDYLDLTKEGDADEALEDIGLLLDNGFLIPNGADPYLPLQMQQRYMRVNHPQIGLMYLLVTNECNLRCEYCSIESIERKPHSFKYSQMGKSMARKGVDLFLEVLGHDILEPKVIYYGGEPLLNWETFRDSLSYIREKQEEGLFNSMNVDVSVVCNGTMITDQIAREMKRLNANASVSIDGLKRHHDLMRKYRDGRGSWEDAMRGYDILKNHQGGCGISCTLGPHNYMDIEEIAEFIATRLECRGLGFNITKGLPPGNMVEIPADVITEKIIKAYEILRSFGIYEDRIMRKIKAFVNEEPWLFDCGGYGGQIALCADGSLGPCHIAADDHRFLWGHIDDQGLKDSILEGSLTRDWCSRTPIKMKQCYDCVGLGICGGGCADEAFVKYGDMFALDKAFCEHCKSVLQWMFDDLAGHLIETGSLTDGLRKRLHKRERIVTS